jgi:hypothetical protein
MLGVTLAKNRSPQQGPSNLPDGLEIISADNHIGLKDNIWFEGFPEHSKGSAPSVVLDHGL